MPPRHPKGGSFSGRWEMRLATARYENHRVINGVFSDMQNVAIANQLRSAPLWTYSAHSYRPAAAKTGATGCCTTCSSPLADALAAVPTAATPGATVCCYTCSRRLHGLCDLVRPEPVRGTDGPKTRGRLSHRSHRDDTAQRHAAGISACRSALLEARIGPDQLEEVANWLCHIVDARPAVRDRATNVLETVNNAMKVSQPAWWAVGGAVGCPTNVVITPTHPRNCHA